MLGKQERKEWKTHGTPAFARTEETVRRFQFVGTVEANAARPRVARRRRLLPHRLDDGSGRARFARPEQALDHVVLVLARDANSAPPALAESPSSLGIISRRPFPALLPSCLVIQVDTVVLLLPLDLLCESRPRLSELLVEGGVGGGGSGPRGWRERDSSGC